MGTRDSGQGAGRVKWTLTNVCSMAEHQSFHVTVNTPLCVSSVSYKESEEASGVTHPEWRLLSLLGKGDVAVEV